MLRKFNCLDALQSAGISYEDACALRRISMTLHRWHELECGDGNSYGSWAIVRGFNTKPFKHDEDEGFPYLEHHHYRHGQGKDSVSYTRLADRERGALKRLAAIMARYPGFAHYVQGDPRGCALYILRPDDMAAIVAAFSSIDSMYNRGIAVYK
jgi:hypothetical protein